MPKSKGSAKKTPQQVRPIPSPPIEENNQSIPSLVSDTKQLELELTSQLKLEELKSGSDNDEEEQYSTPRAESFSPQMSSPSTNTSEDPNFTIFNFNPVSTTFKVSELRSTDNDTYRAWKKELVASALAYGLHRLLLHDNQRSLDAAELYDKGRHSRAAVERNWQAANQRVFSAIQVATQSQTGDAFYEEFMDEQDAADLEAKATQRAPEFIHCNAYELMTRLDKKFDTWNHMKTAEVLWSIWDMRYRAGDDPDKLLNSYKDTLGKLKKHSMDLPNDVQAAIWLRFIPKEWSSIVMNMCCKPTIDWKEIYEAMRQYWVTNCQRKGKSTTPAAPNPEDTNMAENDTYRPRRRHNPRGNNPRFDRYKNQSSQSTQGQDTTCHYCHRKGHIERDCPIKLVEHETIGGEANMLEAIPCPDEENEAEPQVHDANAVSVDISPQKGIADSGAHSNITPFPELLKDVIKLKSPVYFRSINKGQLKATEMGTLVDGKGHSIPNFYHVPGATRTLLSEFQIIKSGQFIFKSTNYMYVLSRGMPEQTLESLIRTIRNHTVMRIPIDQSTGFATFDIISNVNGSAAKQDDRAGVQRMKKSSGQDKPDPSPSAAARASLKQQRNKKGTNHLDISGDDPGESGAYHVELLSGNEDMPHSLGVHLTATSNGPVPAWHCKLGHPSFQTLLKAAETLHLPITPSQVKAWHKNCKCEICVLAKASRSPVGQKHTDNYDATRAGQHLHGDIVLVSVASRPDGKRFRCRSINGELYALVIVDEYTRFVWVYLLQEKSEAPAKIKELLIHLRTRLGLPAERWRSDRAGEFLNKDLIDWMKLYGCTMAPTPAYTPALNGLVERMNRTLYQMVRVFLIQAQSPSTLWGPALEWAAFLHNAMPQSAIDYKTPYKLMYNYTFTMRYTHVFGCNVESNYRPDLQSKLQERTWAGVYVGYDLEAALHKVMDENGNIWTMNDVTFFDDKFDNAQTFFANRYKIPLTSRNIEMNNTFSVLSGLESEDEESTPHTESDPPSDSGTSGEKIPKITENIHENASNGRESIDLISDQTNDSLNHSDFPRNPHTSVTQNVTLPLDPRMTTTEAKNTSDLADTKMAPIREKLIKSSRAPAGFTELKSLMTQNDRFNQWESGQAHVPETIYEQEEIDESDKEVHLEPEEINYIQEINLIHEHNALPLSYKQAMRMPDAKLWDDAFQSEMQSMEEQKVFEECPLPPGKKAIPLNMLFDKKYKSTGELDRHKCRLVAGGHRQRPGIDYKETFAPVGKKKSLAVMMSIVAKQDLELKQIDFTTAFLNTKIEEELYGIPPPGYKVEKPGNVLRILKSLYGTCQANRNWNEEIRSKLKSLGFKQMITDPCIYFKKSRTGKLIVIFLYVDDQSIAYSIEDEAEWFEIKKNISDTYKIKDIGECEWILNMKITRNRAAKTITLSQELYVHQLLNLYDMEDAKPMDSPTTIQPLTKDLPNGVAGVPLDTKDHEKYRSIIGGLLYLANTTRIDISFPVSRLSQYLNEPKEHHLNAAKRVLRYLKGTANYGLVFRADNNNMSDHKLELKSAELKDFTPEGLNRIVAYSDADWATDKDNRKSVSGGIITHNGNIVHWFSKKQELTATSTMEAEYIACSTTTKDIIWFQKWLKELYGTVTPAILNCDNTSAISFTKNDTNHSRTRHIDIRFHFIKDYVESGDLIVRYIPTDDQLADILTKNLSLEKFRHFRDKLLSKV